MALRFISRHHAALVLGYGQQPRYITLHRRQQNGMGNARTER